ncbi:MAG: hypothetical protein V1696_03005 [Candidatus Jorgensenbacteria bacterium]
MDAERRQRAVELRTKEKLSYGEIVKKLGVPKSTLSYWLRDFPLSEEKILELRRKGWQKGEASRERFRNTMRQKREEKANRVYQEYWRKMANLSKDAFLVAGLMLYLGEGDKKNYARVGLVNTDHRVIKFFIKWMVDFLGIPQNRIKAQLNLYENMNIAKEKRFWENELGLQKRQFYNPTIRKLQKASFSYRESYRHGTCGIYFNSVEKKTELMMAVQSFVDKYMNKV